MRFDGQKRTNVGKAIVQSCACHTLCSEIETQCQNCQLTQSSFEHRNKAPPSFDTAIWLSNAQGKGALLGYVA